MALVGRESCPVRRGSLVVAGALLVAGCGGGDGTTPPRSEVPATITVTSAAFADGQQIPREYTCHGAGVAPEVAWRGVPGRATSLALVVSDPDAPSGTFIHWVLYDLPPRDGRLVGSRAPAGAHEAENSRGAAGWTPPCPPSGTHHYLFTLYALDGEPGGGSAQDILDQIGRSTLARGQLTGLVPAD
jgi:Raf kinase inhibitor-like YbhB/YbcL family protein